MSSFYFENAKTIKPTKLSDIDPGGQDGAIWGGFLFRFGPSGSCVIYRMSDYKKVSRLTLDKVDLLKPHSNAVFFGTEYYEEGDEFPLFYTNIYNTYDKAEDKKEGICCVYRITRDGLVFSSELVQVIRVGFAKGSEYWYSEDRRDIRPYGNFVLDKKSNTLCVYVLRDQERKMRIFKFKMPGFTSGELNAEWGARELVLSVEDIISYFDVDYCDFIQGAVCYDGLLYSVEGGTYVTPGSVFPPKFRIYDLEKEEQIFYFELKDCGLFAEPELLDVYEGRMYYSGNQGNFYTLQFE